MVNRIKKLINGTRNAIFTNPYELYKKDKKILDQPFYFKGDNQKAILLIHGWTSVPYELYRLGIYLKENGYAVSAPLLPGHGTTPKNLENIKWSEWLVEIEKTYFDLKKSYSEVYVIGTSIGSSLALILAQKNSDLKGLVLLATPYEFHWEGIIKKIMKLFILLGFPSYGRKCYLFTRKSISKVTRRIAYQSYPMKSLVEVFSLVEESRNVLADIKCPVLVMQSIQDYVIKTDSLEKIYNLIGSSQKEKKYIQKAYHTFISDIENEDVFSGILKFLTKIEK